MEGRALEILMIICLLFCNTGDLCTAANNGSVVNIGVLLNYNTLVGKVAKISLEMARDDINRDTQLLNGARLALHFNDTRGDAIVGGSAALNMLEREVVAIIGPQASEVAEFILHLGDAAKVPVVSFTVTNPLITNDIFPYFVRMAHSDALQMRPIAALAQVYGWRRITAVYSDDEFGSGAVSSLIDALRDVGSELEYRSAISPNADKEAIGEELYKLKTMESRVFVVHMQADLGSRILMEANQIGMMDKGYVWITTDEITSLWDVLLNDSTIASMQGLLGVKTYINQTSSKLVNFTPRWRRQFRLENPDEEKAELNLYGLFAYDAMLMVARAIGKFGNKSFNFKAINRTQFAVESTTDFTQLIKVFQEGPQLLHELLKTNFMGLSGVIQLQHGEIVGSTYEIVNVVGKSYHVVAYWDEETHELSKHLSAASLPSSQNNNIDKLRTVIWPGSSTEVPSGWVQPTSGKRLRIAVPNKAIGFTEFVSVAFDRSSNKSQVTGFCVDVFDAVLSRLDYALQYDAIPYGDEVNYDDIVHQVFLKKFDALVGDITILSNRSQYVDFTQPFTESGLVMVVPINAGEANNAWAFMRPFTAGMWATTGAFFIFTGFLVWLFEHSVNPEFRGKFTEQVVTLLWFSFSTLFFTHREKLVSSLSRLVLVIWLFVVLILTSSYTASLTSILTVQKLNPIVKDVESLKASGARVGYQRGSFVAEYLKQELGIKNLQPYITAEEAGKALSKGPTMEGGVAAIFDEIPYIRIFLASQCNYKMVGPVYRTGGLGFVFPKGSPLVSDISTALLALSEDKEMQEIQAAWFNGTTCTDLGEKVDSSRLSMYSFWGLYLITGTVSLIALIVFFSLLLYDYMRDPNVNASDNSEMDDTSTGKSLKTLSRAVRSFLIYVDQKEGSTSGSEPTVSEVSPSNMPFSTPAFTSSPSYDPRTSPFSSNTLSRRSFSSLDCESVADADENATSRTSSISAPDQITEDIPPRTSPFSSSTLSRRSFSSLDCESVADADENATSPTLSISALDQITEGIPPSTTQ